MSRWISAYLALEKAWVKTSKSPPKRIAPTATQAMGRETDDGLTKSALAVTVAPLEVGKHGHGDLVRRADKVSEKTSYLNDRVW